MFLFVVSCHMMGFHFVFGGFYSFLLAYALMIIDVDVTSEFMGSGWIFMISGFWILLLIREVDCDVCRGEVCVSHD